MKLTLLYIFCFISIASLAQKTNYTITIKDASGNPLVLDPGHYLVEILHPTKGSSINQKSQNGVYKFQAEPGDIFRITNEDDNTVILKEVLNNSYRILERTIDNNVTTETTRQPGTKSTGSTKNYWIGAQLAYNLDGGSSDDIVGGSKIEINPSTLFGNNKRNFLTIIGNIGTFYSKTDKKESEAAISKLVQSSTGLSLGFGFIHELNRNIEVTSTAHRIEFTTNYRLNSFQDPNVDTATIGLSQWRSTALYEFELDAWKNGGKLSLAIEGSVAVFNGETYNRIFGEKRTSKFAFETTLCIPVSEKIGFLANLISTAKISPVYQFGIIIKSDNSQR